MKNGGETSPGVILKDYLVPLHQTSRDIAHNEEMTTSDLMAYSFDGIAKQHACVRRTQPLPSVDAVYIDSQNTPYFIEFKNGKLSNVGKKEPSLTSKVTASVLLALDLHLLESLASLQKKGRFIFVYRDDTTNVYNQQIENHILEESGTDAIKQVNAISWLFRKAESLTKEQFNQTFLPGILPHSQP